MNSSHASVSVVCVYNNPAVRRQCLDRSIEALSDAVSDVEYLPIDNVNGTYASAGAALNHGVSRASNDVVAFVHQDVFLHSLAALTEAAGQLIAGDFGVLGAVGVSSEGRTVGRIRDRVVLLGDAVDQPTVVDSVDEVLFLASRALLLREPLTESPAMAWHAYAVEYGLRARRLGLRTGVADIPLTHNSLTINLDRLDEAHQAIAEGYPDLLPVRTTCGVVTKRTADPRAAATWFPSHRWRYPWLRESLALRKASKATGAGFSSVLADIRRDVDGVIDRSPERRLHIINRSDGRRFLDGSLNPFELARRDGSVVLATSEISGLPAVLSRRPPGSWLLLTNLSRADVEALGPQLSAEQVVLGFHEGIGFWFLLGAPLTELPPQWQSKRATPLGMRALVAQSGV
jgi:hypothetical protein